MIFLVNPKYCAYARVLLLPYTTTLRRPFLVLILCTYSRINQLTTTHHCQLRILYTYTYDIRKIKKNKKHIHNKGLGFEVRFYTSRTMLLIRKYDVLDSPKHYDKELGSLWAFRLTKVRISNSTKGRCFSK